MKFIPAYLTNLSGPALVLLNKVIECLPEYKARLKGEAQVWWNLLLLLLTTSAWPCLSYSLNLGARILAELCTGNIQELEENLRYLFAEQISVVYVKMFIDAKVSFY